MHRVIIFLVAAAFVSCASVQQEQIRERSPEPITEKAKAEEKLEPGLEVVTSNLDFSPAPVGGVAAIHAAMQEPEEVWKENKTGAAVVEARVNANGKILGTKIHKSSGYAGMDAEAMLAVARVRWKPARKNDRPVEAVVRVTVDFNTATDWRSNKD